MRFVLVHGGFHGAWCWDASARELRRAGHEVVALDLPGHGTRHSERATLDGYRDAVLEVLAEGDTLVGHSMGGYVISVAADASPVRLAHLIYLAGGVPVEGKSMAAVHTGDPSGIATYYRVERGRNGDEMVFSSFEGAVHHFFHDCDAETARWAFERLTPEPVAPLEEPIHLSRFWEDTTARSFVACLDDRSGFNYYLEQHVVRLGLDTVYPIMSSHSPFLSRPSDLAGMLAHIASGADGAGR